MDRDPDRFFRFDGPGAQEWWYFDALGDDGRDALVLVWYAALPFDPRYGTATLRHLRDPKRHPAPNPLDHCAIGLSWYREGRTVAYALNAFEHPAFRVAHEPWSVTVDANVLERDTDGYRLRVETPAVDGRRIIRADLKFRPVMGSVPLERDLGDSHDPHVWILAAADCRVEGFVQVEGEPPLEFVGRGYHDHNAGAGEISRSMRTWRWGRAHVGQETFVYYEARTGQGQERRLAIVCRGGVPIDVLEGPTWTDLERGRNGFGIRHDRRTHIELGDGRSLERDVKHLVDDGPFYLRWLADFRVTDASGRSTPARGICEWLEARNLHRPWFNWMIPYRLKRPAPLRDESGSRS